MTKDTFPIEHDSIFGDQPNLASEDTSNWMQCLHPSLQQQPPQQQQYHVPQQLPAGPSVLPQQPPQQLMINDSVVIDDSSIFGVASQDSSQWMEHLLQQQQPPQQKQYQIPQQLPACPSVLQQQPLQQLVINDSVLIDDSSIFGVHPNMASQNSTQWMQHLLQQQQPPQQQQYQVPQQLPAGPSVLPPFFVAETSNLDAGYTEPVVGMLPDTPTGGRKRIVSADAVEKAAERRQKRLMKNRETAAQSRARKEAHIRELENKLARLEKHNPILTQQQQQHVCLVANGQCQTRADPRVNSICRLLLMFLQSRLDISERMGLDTEMIRGLPLVPLTQQQTMEMINEPLVQPPEAQQHMPSAPVVVPPAPSDDPMDKASSSTEEPESEDY